MASITKSRRRQIRHSVSPDRDAWVEFEHPCPSGRHHRLTVANLSCSGVSFLFDPDEHLAGVEPGSEVPGALLRIGDCMISGDLLIMHLTPGPGSEHLCGALFYPKDEADLVKLKSVIAGMEAAGAS